MRFHPTHLPRCAFHLAAALVLLPTATTHAQPAIPRGTVLSRTMHSPSLEHNALGDPADQRVDVYLPPSYDHDTARRYPVIYLLHGFLGGPDDFTRPTFQNVTVQGAMDSLIASGRVREMIVAVPNGRNRYGGAFYTNSATSGDWGDYVRRDLIAWMDTTFRTIAAPASRGIAGHSMGGYAALRFGMERPQVFGAVYAISPCCVDMPNEFAGDSPVWEAARNARSADELWAMVNKGDVWPMHIVAAAAAWSPNPQHGPLFVDFPLRKGGAIDSAIQARWDRQFPMQLAPAHVAELRALRGLRFDAGTKDEYAHVVPTTRELSHRLAELGVPHQYELFDGGHRDRLGRRMSTRILPFFSEVLSFGEVMQ